VRYVGEPIAVVLARDRYTAADALELIEVFRTGPCRR
jgi:carbon-monoxide dehydrogenase large subunit